MAHPVFANTTQARPDDRAGFITKTYMHLAASILIFMGLESLLLNSVEGQKLGKSLYGALDVGFWRIYDCFLDGIFFCSQC